MKIFELLENTQRGTGGEIQLTDAIVDLLKEQDVLAYQFAGSRQEAEDLTQDIFLKLYSSLAKYDFNHDFTAWFLTLARNYLIDEFRRTRIEKSQRFEGEEPDLPASKDDPDLQSIA